MKVKAVLFCFLMSISSYSQQIAPVRIGGDSIQSTSTTAKISEFKSKMYIFAKTHKTALIALVTIGAICMIVYMIYTSAPHKDKSKETSDDDASADSASSGGTGGTGGGSSSGSSGGGASSGGVSGGGARGAGGGGASSGGVSSGGGGGGASSGGGGGGGGGTGGGSSGGVSGRGASSGGVSGRGASSGGGGDGTCRDIRSSPVINPTIPKQTAHASDVRGTPINGNRRSGGDNSPSSSGRGHAASGGTLNAEQADTRLPKPKVPAHQPRKNTLPTEEPRPEPKQADAKRNPNNSDIAKHAQYIEDSIKKYTAEEQVKIDKHKQWAQAKIDTYKQDVEANTASCDKQFMDGIGEYTQKVEAAIKEYKECAAKNTGIVTEKEATDYMQEVRTKLDGLTEAAKNAISKENQDKRAQLEAKIAKMQYVLTWVQKATYQIQTDQRELTKLRKIDPEKSIAQIQEKQQELTKQIQIKQRALLDQSIENKRTLCTERETSSKQLSDSISYIDFTGGLLALERDTQSAKSHLFSKATQDKLDSLIPNSQSEKSLAQKRLDEVKFSRAKDSKESDKLRAQKWLDKRKFSRAEISLEKLIRSKGAISKLQVNSPFNEGQIVILRKLYNAQIECRVDLSGDPSSDIQDLLNSLMPAEGIYFYPESDSELTYYTNEAFTKTINDTAIKRSIPLIKDVPAGINYNRAVAPKRIKTIFDLS